jgi:acetolactate synthase small subunit
MNWLYLVTTEDRPRVQSRIMQVFDKQLISVDSFFAVKLGGQVYMRIAADTEACPGLRLKALLHRLEDVLAIRAIQTRDEGSRISSIFHASCARPEQVSLLETLLALGAAVTHVTPCNIVFEVVGHETEIEDIYQSLRLRWPLQKMLDKPTAPGQQTL